METSIDENAKENTRQYSSKQGKYCMPVEEVEQQRLDLQHTVITMRLGGKLGLPPSKTSGTI